MATELAVRLSRMFLGGTKSQEGKKKTKDVERRALREIVNGTKKSRKQSAGVPTAEKSICKRLSQKKGSDEEDHVVVRTRADANATLLSGMEQNGIESEKKEDNGLNEGIRKHIESVMAKDISPGHNMEAVTPIQLDLVGVNPTSLASTLGSEYFQDILDDMFANEDKFRPQVDYMRTVQDELRPSMRAVVVEWLSEVVDAFQLDSKILFATVNVLDRFLSVVPVVQRHLQLVGVGSLLIASKMVTSGAPLVSDLVIISSNAYTPDQIRLIESIVLQKLDFAVNVATAPSFLDMFISFANIPISLKTEVSKLANYFCDLSLLDYSLLATKPSLISAASISLALRMMGVKEWGDELERVTQLRAMDLVQTLDALFELHIKAPKKRHQSIRRKHAFF